MTDVLAVPNRCLLWLTGFCALLARELPALQRQAESCEQYEAAVRADPDNKDAASRLGRCIVRDFEMIAPDGDSTRLRFRSSWSTALRVLRHAVALDPAYGPAYRPLFGILFAETRDGCSAVTGECWHVSSVLRSGDTVITVPRLVHQNGPGPDTYDVVIRESRAAQRTSLIEARDLARRWAEVAPNEPRAHQYLGRALLRLGDAEAATVELDRAATLGTARIRNELFWERAEAFVKSDRGEEVRRLIDETSNDPGRDTSEIRNYSLAGLNALVGRFRPPPVDSAWLRQIRPRLDSMRRNRPPPSPPRKGIMELLTLGDSVGAWRELARMDSMITPAGGGTRFAMVGAQHFQSATHHLALGDTAGAQARLEQIERGFNEHPFVFSAGVRNGFERPWMGHAWLLSGDLAARRHQPDEAARMYRRIIGLWGGGDPAVQPVVDQARARLATQSGR